MFDSYLDIVEERDGYRVRLEIDQDAQEPYDDGAVPTLRIGGDYYGGGDAEAFNKQAEPYVRAFNRFGDVAGTNAQQREIFARYVRIFHDAIKVQEYNTGVSREYGYIGFDTAAWREEVGAPVDRLKDEDYLSEVRAWAEGDVYGVIVEKQLHYTKTYAEDPTYSEEDAEWVEVEDGSVWGHYGRSWAEQAAREALTEAIEWDKANPAPEAAEASEGTPGPERSHTRIQLERVLEDLEVGATEVAKTRIRGLLKDGAL